MNKKKEEYWKRVVVVSFVRRLPDQWVTEDEVVTRQNIPLHKLNKAGQIRVHHLLNATPTTTTVTTATMAAMAAMAATSASRKQRRKWNAQGKGRSRKKKPEE